MSWKCQWNKCKHVETYLSDMANHQFNKHKDKPKEIGIICVEEQDKTTSVTDGISKENQT